MDIGTDELSWLPFVLQTADPLFPTGAYAHSFGLEELVRLGIVSSEPSLMRFLREQILPALAHFELPFLRFAHDAAVCGDVDALCRLDAEVDAWKICRELREASIQQGRRRMETLQQIAPSLLLNDFAARATPAHHIVVYALQMADVPRRAMLGAYSYQTLAAFCTAALKLIRIGQLGCQRVLRDCLLDVPVAITASASVSSEDAGWFNPVIEIASMRHETAFERLFIS